MSKVKKETPTIADSTNNANFRINKINKKKIWENMYTDEISSYNRRGRYMPASPRWDFKTAKDVQDELRKAIGNRNAVVQASQELYATNPIYANIINYLCNLFLWRYKIIPHKVFKKSKAQQRKDVSKEDYQLIYNHMLEVVDGLNIETLFPRLLQTLFINASVYFTTICDPETLVIDTLILPDKYCRKTGSTQFGTGIIQMDMSYFDSVQTTDTNACDSFVNSFGKEIKSAYEKYKGDKSKRWVTLDPRFSSCVMLNNYSIPVFFYLYGGILNYEQYQANELQRNENLLKYIVVQTMPVYQDRLIFENDEVQALHNSMKKIIDHGDQARLLTTYGTVKVERIAEDESTQNDILAKALQTIYNDVGLNPTLFTGNSVDALNKALVRDQGLVWRYVQQILNFYTIAINNGFDFKTYQADIEILRISPYTYNDDVEVYKTNATLGVGKLDYIIATGTKQKNILDTFKLESFLQLDKLQPMQTSYTQAPEDREDNDDEDKKDSSKDNNNETDRNTEDQDTNKNDNFGIEPSKE